MVDLATLRGLVPGLASVPALLYFHENQFSYPGQRQQHSLLEAQMVSLYAALAANAIAFNSAYNRDTFLAGCQALLTRLPDAVPPGIVDELQRKAQVLPVPLLPQPRPVTAATRSPCGHASPRPLRLLWSARFEHDKGGEGLYLLLGELERAGLDYELALTGQQFRNSPPAFGRIQTQYAHRLACFGYLDSAAEYADLQRGADIVVSTALHEFQGLAVMQAVAAGCVPVVPDRLAYREIYDAAYRYPSLPESPDDEAVGAARLILSMAAGMPAAPDMSAYRLDEVKPLYQTVLGSLQHSQPWPS
jgi:glycosyltransferase involved in cell wall biosynthesis